METVQIIISEHAQRHLLLLLLCFKISQHRGDWRRKSHLLIFQFNKSIIPQAYREAER